MRLREYQRFVDLPRNIADNHFLYYREHVNPNVANPWTRPVKTLALRTREVRGKRRKIRDFFEDFSLKNFGAMLKWFWSWLKHRFQRTHKFVTYKVGNQKTAGILRIEPECRILLASDWGTATVDAIAVANKMRNLINKDSDPLSAVRPVITIHLGDVYYTGEKEEYRDYFFPYWPVGTHKAYPTLLLNANHEMYSGGHGYFDYAIKQVNQETSYFCLENDYWRIIGLDTGYHSVKADKGRADKEKSNKLKLPKALVKWLRDVVFADPNDRRSLILLSHHQWFCSFGSEYHRPAQQLSAWINRPVLWFWGHEHVFAAYSLTEAVKDAKGKTVKGIPVYARCIGHGGMPAQIERLNKKLAENRKKGRLRDLVVWDQRIGSSVKETELGYNGFVDLMFQGSKVVVSYYDRQEAVLKESWQATPSGVQGTLLYNKLEPEAGRRIEELFGPTTDRQAA
ncbi:MAG: metallophosphoesterase family protein [bacterium]